VGGVDDLLHSFPTASVVGFEPDRYRIPQITQPVQDNEVFSMLNQPVRVLHIPGHTLGAIAYFFETHDSPSVFVGDTLFGAGCGRLFEGTPAQMYHSLHGVLGSLLPSTSVYFGHEYTKANLQFAETIEPTNSRIRERLAATNVLRSRGRPTTPSHLADEFTTNPFLRCHMAEVRAFVNATGATSDVEVWQRLRRAKDTFG